MREPLTRDEIARLLRRGADLAEENARLRKALNECMEEAHDRGEYSLIERVARAALAGKPEEKP